MNVLSPRAAAASVSQALALVSRNRGLVAAMTQRELSDRYTRQFLGAAWALLTPLLTMAVYVFVFTFIFRGRLGVDNSGPAFTAYILAGLTPWLAVQEGLARSVSAVTGNGNLVKQIVFPSEVLPLKIALATLPTLLVGLAVTIVVSVIAGQASLLRVLLLTPAAIAIYTVMLAGLGYLLAAVGVFFRDLKDIVAFFLSIGLFLHPILFPPGVAPPWLENSFTYSPFSHLIWCFREALMGPIDPHPWSWLIAGLWAFALFVLGWRTFRVLKPAFGNAL